MLEGFNFSSEPDTFLQTIDFKNGGYNPAKEIDSLRSKRNNLADTIRWIPMPRFGYPPYRLFRMEMMEI